ncbi:NAD(P)/FAD-dependent oxidoreductase [Psychroflexus halocasei]|uniref:Glycine/D-amino acid oxidase n=1 Tax=Psychroflexus halocasei TaxID=908615 RepID=A0A1H3VF84_9FLAO|nr:FAD-dependent oxidoreductase [Psychroflexus halocasei]SDZ73443.1 Glycine/D-amino acid oxidase [Psychroflexus halocasei]
MFNNTLIVGFGIAGVTIAHRLHNSNHKFKIISDQSQCASRTAGGVINPIALKRYKKAWKADVFYHEAIKFYRFLETRLDADLLKSKPIYKALNSAEDQNDFLIASDRNFLDQFLSPKILSDSKIFTTTDVIGEVKSTFTIDLNSLLDSSAEFFRDIYISDSFRFEELEFLENGHFLYRNETFTHVIFCEGFGININPFFNDLPIYGNKGEYLIISSTDLNYQEVILKSRYFLIPLGGDLYKFGANYDRKSLNNQPTKETRDHLKIEFEKMITCEYEIVNQVAGVRPTVKDRKPVLGCHPKHCNLYVFNGFGSRGVLAAPSLSETLYEFIFNDKELHKEINVKRFYSPL